MIEFKRYIRFGDVPDSEASGVFNSDNGIVRNEDGVSVFESEIEGNIHKIVLPSFSTGPLHDIGNFMSDNKGKIYLVFGNKVGTGIYGEPLLKDLKIINELFPLELADKNSKDKLCRTNIQLVNQAYLDGLKIKNFVERLRKIGIEIKLSSNYPWVYIDEINGVPVKDKYQSDYGFTVAFMPVRRDGKLKFSDISEIFKLLRKYTK